VLHAVSLVTRIREFLSLEQGFFNWNREEYEIPVPHGFRPFQWFEPLQKLITQPSLSPSSTALPRRAIRHDAQGPYPAQKYGNPKADPLSIP
jgi:hypothetical protein